MMLQAAVDMSLKALPPGYQQQHQPCRDRGGRILLRNPAPVDRVDRWYIGGSNMFTPLFTGFQHVSSIQGGAGFLPSTVGIAMV